MTLRSLLPMLVVLLIASGICAHAAVIWPSDQLWRPITFGGGRLPDPDNDYTGANGTPYLDIEGNSTYAAGYWYFTSSGTLAVDDDILMFRMRLDGNAQRATYQFSFDTNQTPSSVDWVVQLDDVDDHAVELVQTEVAGLTYGDVSLSTVNTWQGAYADYARIFLPTMDGSNFNGNPDYFIDIAIPWTVWQTATGLTQQDLWRVQLSTATQHNVLNKDFPQGWGSSDPVSNGFSDPISAPEPGTLALVGISLTGLMLKKRRQRS
jgi:hypothetical protein